MKIYLLKSPRTLFIHSNGFVLQLKDISRQPRSNPKLIIEFVNEASLNVSTNSQDFIQIPTFNNDENRAYGIIGIINIKGYTFVGFITERIEVGCAGTVSNKIFKILNTNFVCLNSDEFDNAHHSTRHSSLDDDLASPTNESSSELAASGNGDGVSGVDESPIYKINKLLSSGDFYYSDQFDISTNAQERVLSNLNFINSLDSFDSRYVWNRHLISGLISFKNRLSSFETDKFDEGGFLVTMTRGFAQTLTVNDTYLLTIISKQDCSKQGEMFGPYCMDDEGNVTGFIESEVIISDNKRNLIYSFVLLRGNPPLFWKFESQLISTKIEFPRSIEASRHSIEKFFDALTSKFGGVQIIDCLSKRSNQPELSDRYFNAVKLIDYYPNIIQYLKVDISKYGNYDLNSIISNLSESFTAYNVFGLTNDTIKTKQLGTYLINSLNSNERMNEISKKISEEMIDLIGKKELGLDIDLGFWARHSALWNENGNKLNKMADRYITRKIKNKTGGIVGKVAEHSKKYVVAAASSTNQNHSNKQNRFDRLLGRTKDNVEVKLVDPIHDYIRDELGRRQSEFSTKKQLLVYCATFNVNAEMYEGDLKDLLFNKEIKDNNYDIVIIGLEEVVELTPSKIMNIDPSIKLFWENKILRLLGDSYLLIKNEQLGGLLSLVYIKSNHLEDISNIESSSKKTGMKGMSVNKGGVAISFNYCEHKFLFIVSHLAAGLNNVIERHTNYKTIAKGLRFRQNKTIRDFNFIVWMGDFNFRIDLPNEIVKPLIQIGDLKTLLEKDQLNAQMSKGESFPYFNEMEIKFKPTYKYDKGTNEFDSSEKQRIPAWTDRILHLSRGGLKVEQLNYDAVHDICFSDHKPVFGVFKCTVNVIDEESKSKIEKQLYEDRKCTATPSTTDTTLNYENNEYLDDDDDEFVLGHGLPAPSSNERKWWCNGGTSIKVKFEELDKLGLEINPNLPKNPFKITNEDKVFV